MTIEAMKLALEALELWSPALGHALNKRAEAVVALRAAIEHAERPMTHSADCWRWHHACARAWIERAKKQDWDGRHPKAQALIGAKARLEIKLRLVEQLVDDPSFEPTALDTEFWEPLHDKLNDKLNERLAQPRQWQGLTDEDLDIRALWDVLAGMKNADGSIVVQFARAIEAKLKEKNG